MIHRKQFSTPPRRVVLFVTCMVDMIYPEVGIATAELLERFGIEVVFAYEQTCCGQPAFNAGFRHEARTLARRFLDVFEPFIADGVVDAIADLGQVVDQSERVLLTGNGESRAILKTVRAMDIGRDSFYIESFIDISERKKAEEDREQLIVELQAAVAKVKTLSGLLPICASCKKIRDDEGYWNQIEGYIQKHSEAQFSHGICPDCAKKMYPYLDLFKE